MAIIKYSDYASFENQFDNCMLATANNFVAIGYLLKQARDTDILKESGYSSMGEFARTRYGLDESKTSRFIAICEKFGNGEDRLIPEYESFGYAKLSEMLLLPDNISEVITPEMTREEIREIKQEVRDEQSISPIELALEENEKTDEDILVTIMREYLRSRPEEFSNLFEAFKNHDGPEIKQIIADILAPAGIGILVQRISGKGKFMLKIEGIDNPVTLVDVRNETNTSVTWDHFYFCINEALPYDLRNLKANEAYREIYGEDMPEIKKEPEKKPERIKTEKKAEKKEKNNKIAPAQKSEKEAAKPEPTEKEDLSGAAGQEEIQQAYRKTFEIIRGIEKQLGERDWRGAHDGADALSDTIGWIQEQNPEDISTALDAEFDNE